MTEQALPRHGAAGVVIFVVVCILLLGPIVAVSGTLYHMMGAQREVSENPDAELAGLAEEMESALVLTLVGLGTYTLGVILTVLIAKLWSRRLARALRREAIVMAVLLLLAFPEGTVLGAISLVFLICIKDSFETTPLTGSHIPRSGEPVEPQAPQGA